MTPRGPSPWRFRRDCVASGAACPSPNTTWGRDGGRFAPAGMYIDRMLSIRPFDAVLKPVTPEPR
jgi:hypothetical protein